MAFTRSGVQPKKQNYLYFEVSTQDVKKFLQKKMDDVTRSKGMERIQVSLVSADIGKKFKPFLLLLPLDVDEEYREFFENEEEETEVEEEVNPIFEPNNQYDDEDEVREAKIIKPVSSAIVYPYLYSKSDVADICGSTFRSNYIVSRRMAVCVKSFATPRITNVQRYDGTYCQMIFVLLDPIRVFVDMLANGEENDLGQYYVDVMKIHPIKAGNYKYELKKYRKKQKRGQKGYMSLEDSVSQMINRGDIQTKVHEKKKKKKKQQRYDENLFTEKPQQNEQRTRYNNHNRRDRQRRYR